MKVFSPTALFLLLWLPSIPLFSTAETNAAEAVLLTVHTGTAASLNRPSADTPALRFPWIYDPLPAGSLAAGVKPGLNLLDISCYSLRLSLPVTWSGFSGLNEEGWGFLSAGLMASVEMKSLPGRYGFVLNTGLFLIRRDQNFWDEPSYLYDSEYMGGFGAVNISIIY